jgi:hypothetical protein
MLSVIMLNVVILSVVAPPINICWPTDRALVVSTKHVCRTNVFGPIALEPFWHGFEEQIIIYLYLKI